MEEENKTENIEQNSIEEIVEDEINVQQDNIDESKEDISDLKNTLVNVRPVKFEKFDEEKVNRSMKKNLDIMQDVSMHITVELGRTKLSIKDVMELEKGSVVELNKIAGEQVEVFVNDKLSAKGEVIVIEDKFGVRITTTNFSKENF